MVSGSSVSPSGMIVTMIGKSVSLREFEVPLVVGRVRT